MQTSKKEGAKMSIFGQFCVQDWTAEIRQDFILPIMYRFSDIYIEWHNIWSFTSQIF